MLTAKYEMIYLEKWFSGHSFWSRFLIYLSAFTTSGAIAGWAIWEKWKGIWMAIVLISQALNVFFPRGQMEEKAAILQKLPLVWQPKYNSFEEGWYSVMGGSLNAEEIRKRVYAFRKDWEGSENTIIKDIRPGLGSRILSRISTKATNHYFDQLFDDK